jgi:diguanylate cyclase (GGDEF)-like protein
MKPWFQIPLLLTKDSRQTYLTSLTLGLITLTSTLFLVLVIFYYPIDPDTSLEGAPFFAALSFVSGAGWYLSKSGRWLWVRRLPAIFFFLIGVYGSFAFSFHTLLTFGYVLAIMLTGLLVNRNEMVLVAVLGLVMHLTGAALTSDQGLYPLSAGIITLTAMFTGICLLLWLNIVLFESALEHSMIDPFTKTFNRGYFDATLQLLGPSHRYPISILMADINDLKKVNDALGHNSGDTLILRTSQCLRAACRVDDVICRIGGDEFAVIFPSTDEKAVDEIAIRLSEHIESDNRAHPDVPLSLAIGTATAVDPNSLSEQLALADRSMYANKREYKQTFPE